MDDATLVNLLPDMIKQAAIAKLARPGQINGQADAAGGTLAPGAPASAASAPQGGMTQQQFGGQPYSQQQRLLQQQKLAQMLRARQAAEAASAAQQ
jgi:hypothetical protein